MAVDKEDFRFGFLQRRRSDVLGGLLETAMNGRPVLKCYYLEAYNNPAESPDNLKERKR